MEKRHNASLDVAGEVRENASVGQRLAYLHRSPSAGIRSARQRRPFFMSGPGISRPGRRPSYDDGLAGVLTS